MSTPVLANAHATGEHCPWCCPHPGWVVAFTRADGSEEMGPCPNCELGKRIEFGAVGSQQWGVEGFWRGRATNLKRACRCAEPRSGRPDEARQWKELLMTKTQDVDPAPVSRDITAALAAGGAADPSSGVAQTPSPGQEPGSTTHEAPTTSGASHHCPTYRRDVPWSQEECASCNPAEETTL